MNALWSTEQKKQTQTKNFPLKDDTGFSFSLKRVWRKQVTIYFSESLSPGSAQTIPFEINIRGITQIIKAFELRKTSARKDKVLKMSFLQQTSK